MLKLIACDMDGTLLNSQKQLPPQLPALLQKLREMNVTFAVASGRSKVALTNLFGEWADEMIFICDNGACVQMPHAEPVFQCLPFEIVHQVLEICSQQEHVVPVLCCTHGIYYPVSAKEQFQQEINNFYVQFTTCSYEELYRITDPVMKIALCDLNNPAKHIYPILNPLIGAQYELAVSGPLWMDIMCKGAHKGDDQFSIHFQGIDILFLKDDADPQFLQCPNILQAVQRVSGKPGYGLCQDQINFLLTAFADHAVEIIPLFCRSACNSLIGKDARHCPLWIGHNLVRVISTLGFIAGLLFFLLCGNPAVGSYPKLSLDSLLTSLRLCRDHCYCPLEIVQFIHPFPQSGRFSV